MLRKPTLSTNSSSPCFHPSCLSLFLWNQTLLSHLYLISFIYPDGVAKQLNKLDASKASGPDEQPSRFLKLVADELAPALCFLFQQSITSGQVPVDWGKAIVSPIYKKGTKSDPANYRPISLTCICCKVLEHIVLSHMAKHLSHHHIILDSQHGFRERLSSHSTYYIRQRLEYHSWTPWTVWCYFAGLQQSLWPCIT